MAGCNALSVLSRAQRCGVPRHCCSGGISGNPKGFHTTGGHEGLNKGRVETTVMQASTAEHTCGDRDYLRLRLGRA